MIKSYISKVLVQILIQVLPLIVERISMELKESLQGFIISMHVDAMASDNPFDDIAVIFLASLFDVELHD